MMDESTEVNHIIDLIKNIQRVSLEVVDKALRDEQLDKDLKYDLARSMLRLPNTNKSAYLKMRFEIFKRDDFSCVYCGRSTVDKAKLHIDHIKPRSLGGTDDYDNLVTSCFECNLGKKDFLLEQRHQDKIRQKRSG